MAYIISRRTFVMMALSGAFSPIVVSASNAHRQIVLDMVNRASTAIKTYDFPDALRHTKTDTWRKLESGLYVFVIDKDGVLHLHIDKKMEGANVSGSTDPSGNQFIREIIAKTAVTSDGIWTDYIWPSPKTGKLESKHTYARAAGDYIVAAGYYAHSA